MFSFSPERKRERARETNEENENSSLDEMKQLKRKLLKKMHILRCQLKFAFENYYEFYHKIRHQFDIWSPFRTRNSNIYKIN